jgi:hypothetical protein
MRAAPIAPEKPTDYAEELPAGEPGVGLTARRLLLSGASVAAPRGRRIDRLSLTPRAE